MKSHYFLKMTFVKLNYYGAELSANFTTHLYTEAANRDVYFGGWDASVQMPCPLKFCMVETAKSNSKYASSAAIAMYRFVLMDGNHGLFKAVCNSNISGVLRSAKLMPGTTIVVKRYHWIWRGDMTSDEETDGELWRGVMVIDDIDWIAGPPEEDNGTGDAVSTVSIDFDSILLDREAVDEVSQNNSVIVLTVSSEEDTDTSEDCYVRMPFVSVKSGDFIRDAATKRAWVCALKKRSREDNDSASGTPECKCMYNYYLPECVMKGGGC